MRISAYNLPDDVLSALRAMPGIRVRSASVEYPADCAEFVQALVPGAPPPPNFVPRSLALPATEIEGYEKFKTWQQFGVNALADGRIKFLWWPPGSGKTSALLAAARARGAKKTLILTRAIGVNSFVRDSKWAGGLFVWPVRGRGPDFKIEAAYRKADAILVNYEVLDARLPALGQLQFDLMICDEAHFLRSHKHKEYAIWVKAAEALAQNIYLRGGDIWQATATPIADRRRDLWRQLAIAFPDRRFGTSWAFYHYFCGARRNQYNGLDTTGRTHTEELHSRLLHYVDRRTKAEVAKELPKLRRERIHVECDATKLRHPNGIENAIAEAASIKLEYGVELAVDRLSGPGKVIIVTNRHREMARLEKKLRAATKGIRGIQIFCTESVTGSALDVDRRKLVCDAYFHADDPALLLATADSISESIDLQRTDALINLSLPYKPVQIEQLEGRVSRIGQDRPVTVYYLIAEGTYDEVIEDRLLSKLSDTEDLETTTTGGIASTFKISLSDDEMKAAFDDWISRVGEVVTDDE